MKKVIFSFIATAMFSAVSFANTPTLENEIEIKKENQVVSDKTDNKEKETVCTRSCSRVIAGVTYTTEAGNWFTSCETASERCEKKLDQLSFQ